MDWKHRLPYITGTVDQELLLRNEYLVTENRMLRSQIKGRVRLSDGERQTLAELGQKLGKQALQEVAKIVKPDTILGWHRELVVELFCLVLANRVGEAVAELLVGERHRAVAIGRVLQHWF